MTKVLVDDTNLTNIANAIRGKNGSSDTYTPSQMATAITNIPSGGGRETVTLTYTNLGPPLPDPPEIFCTNNGVMTTITQYGTYNVDKNTTVCCRSGVALDGNITRYQDYGSEIVFVYGDFTAISQ